MELTSPIEYLKGVGPAKGALLQKELSIFTLEDLLNHFPFRYIDRTQFFDIQSLPHHTGHVQVKGVLSRVQLLGQGRKKRLTAQLKDPTGTLELIWFSGITWIQKQLVEGAEYIAFGKIQVYFDQVNMPHPELERLEGQPIKKAQRLEPVYSSTEKLNAKGLDTRNRRKLIQHLFEKIRKEALPENLSNDLLNELQLLNRYEAYLNIHLPANNELLSRAIFRLKFEELFFLQLRLFMLKKVRKKNLKGFVFEKIGSYFNDFYQHHLPFNLTKAQQRVIKEIRQDLKAGIQMNRLLQGDVGSGKTIVAVLCILMALDNGFQSCLMAPTEILAKQHFEGIRELLIPLGIQVAYLSGSVKGKPRKEILEELANGHIDVLIGTHALIEPKVEFKQLGLAIIDEQHRFGVAQRAKLWNKSRPFPPHVLVMTATPIPRTLAMTLYGDLDVSVIDELPPGRKAVQTIHQTENNRLRVFGFMQEQIQIGRQIYVVYPLIEESETLDLQNLMEGYEAISRAFPMPDYQISIVHGKMKPADKDFEMQRFVTGQTQIMVATTVIEVGVNVPNASVMIIENTERFGLSQLHQLRGRVGRGADQSYCILMSSFKLSNEAKKRIKTMVDTNNGFEIAEADLELRGPGTIEGTQQSGLISFKLADISKDQALLKQARNLANTITEKDPQLMTPMNAPLKKHIEKHYQHVKGWSRIS